MVNNDKLVYGGDLMLFLATGATVMALAFSTSAKLAISMDTREISSKDSTGDFKDYAAGKFGWTVSSDALVNYSSTGNTNSVDELYTMMISKSLVNIAFASKAGTSTSPSWTVSTTSKKYTGQAYITSIDLNASDNDNATYSINLQGTGALVQA